MSPSSNDVVKVYKDQADEWRWKFVAGNNKIMADSGEGYLEKGDCQDACAHVLGGWITGHILEAEQVEEGTLTQEPVTKYVMFVQRYDGTLVQVLEVS